METKVNLGLKIVVTKTHTKVLKEFGVRQRLTKFPENYMSPPDAVPNNDEGFINEAFIFWF